MGRRQYASWSESRMLSAGWCRFFFILLAICASVGWGRGAAQEAASPDEVMAHGFDCFSCHAIKRDIVGPAWIRIANRYNHDPSKADYLANKIINGSVGDFGKVPMPAHKDMSPKLAKQLATYILTLKGKLEEGPSKHYRYKNLDGKTVTVDFQVFQQSDGKKIVTDNIFGGFEKYNSYCFRCHGFDAAGGEYAPDLRQSLINGMTRREFFTVAMEGREAKGMPGWNGFFTADELEQVYEYVKARSLDLIGPGRPPSKED
jgi:cytochrome c